MARTSRSEAAEPRARLFVALELERGGLSELAAWRDTAFGGEEALRLVPAGQLHVTLAFLGSRPETEAEAIAAALRSACASSAVAVRFESGGPKALPPRRSRLVALELRDPTGACASLAQAVADALSAGGFYEPERRPFWPHVTLARVRKGGRADLSWSIPDPPAGPFMASKVTLLRSRTRPSGAVYEPLTRFELPLSARA